MLLGAKRRKKRYLEDEEEDELVRFLIKCANIGYPRSRSEVVAIVQRICNSRKLDIIVSLGWWKQFCQRHPDISLRTASMLSRSRVVGSNTEAIDTYFDISEDTLAEYSLLDKPGQLHNMDEKGVSLDSKSLNAHII